MTRPPDHPISSIGVLLTGKNELKETHNEHQRDQRSPQPGTMRERSIVLEFPQQVSPGRKGLGDSESEHSQICFRKNEERNRYPELSDEDGLHVREYLAQ